MASEMKRFNRKDMKDPLYCLNVVLCEAVTDVNKLKKASEYMKTG